MPIYPCFKKICLGLFFSGLLLTFGHGAKALTVSPVLFDQNLDPGMSANGQIGLTNDTNQTQTYYVSVQNFVANGEEGEQTFLEEKDTSGLAGWLKTEKDQVTLAPTMQENINWTINLPKNAEPGGHYAAVFFSTQPPTESQTAVGVGAKIGVLFLINVSGNIKEAASVETFRLMDSPDENAKAVSVIERLPAYFELRVKNNGSVHIQPMGTVTIKNLFGSTVASIPANPAKSRVLPDSIRRIRPLWGIFEKDKTVGFWKNLQKEWTGFALGRYTATLDATYGTQHQPLQVSMAFWVFPWRLCLMALLLLILLIVLLKVYNKMLIKSALRKTGK